MLFNTESQGAAELLTAERASLGHCSACTTWQIGAIYLSRVIGGGVSLRTQSKNKTCSQRPSAVARWPPERRSHGPLCSCLSGSSLCSPSPGQPVSRC